MNKERHLMILRIGIVAIVSALAGAGAWRSTHSDAHFATTALPEREGSHPLNVGPLVIPTASVLRIFAPEFRAELSDKGSGKISKADMSRKPPEFGAPTAFTLDAETFARLLAELGKLKASWSARKVGEAAATESTGTGSSGSLAVVPDRADSHAQNISAGTTPLIVIEEIASDGTPHLILEISTESPEYTEIHNALTPLRLTK